MSRTCFTSLENLPSMLIGSRIIVPKERATEAAQTTPKLTTGEWLQTWFDLYSKPNLRETTQEQYTNFIEKHMIPNIGDIPLEKLTWMWTSTVSPSARW